MKPRQIRVFDGLRITTEHLNHLQEALYSAVQDLRGIVGAGRVHQGFEVVVQDERTVAVSPGVAFDLHKNRIVSGEPIRLEVEFDSGAQTQYVCLKYQEMEDGAVEGQCTRIWDSCLALLQAELPPAESDLIPIATVTRRDGTLEALPLPAEQAGGRENGVGEEPGETWEATGGPAAGAPAPEEEGYEGTLPEDHDAVAEEEVSLSTGASEVEAPSGLEGPAAGLALPELRVQQGILRLDADPAQTHILHTTLVEVLSEKLRRGGSTEPEELLLKLGEGSVSLDFPVSSLTCQVILSCSCGSPAGVTSAGPAEAEEGPSAAGENETGAAEDGEGAVSPAKPVGCWEWRATARGEATFVGDVVSQFGLSVGQSSLQGEAGAIPGSVVELTDRGIAHLPLCVAGEHPDDRRMADMWDVFRRLQVLVKVDKTQGRGFETICYLTWKGEIHEQIIARVQSLPSEFRWGMLVAWKALGQSHA